MTIDYKDLGKRIRTARRQFAMTQEDLAEKIGISTSFMGHIERGSRVASLETLVSLCNTLQVTPQYLLSASLNICDQYTFSDNSQGNHEKLSDYLRLSQDTMTDWND